MAADGRGLQDPHINDKFAKLAESLYIADRKAREAVETRANLERKLAQREKDKKEQMLSNLAEEARKKRSGLSTCKLCFCFYLVLFNSLKVHSLFDQVLRILIYMI